MAGLHLMFMGQYTEQWNALDLIAERIRALGQPAPRACNEFVELAAIKEVEGVPSANDMIRQWVAAQEATARTPRRLIDVVTKANNRGRDPLLNEPLSRTCCVHRSP